MSRLIFLSDTQEEMDSLECVSLFQSLCIFNYPEPLTLTMEHNPSKPGTVGWSREQSLSSCFCSFSCCRGRRGPSFLPSSRGPIFKRQEIELKHSASWILKLSWKQRLLQPKQVHSTGESNLLVHLFLYKCICKDWTWELLTFSSF